MKRKNLIRYIFLLLLFTIMLVFSIKLGLLNIIPLNYFILFITLEVVLFILLALLSFRKHKTFRIIGYVLIIIFILGFFIGIVYENATESFFTDVFNVSDEYVEYYVIVNKKSDHRKLKHLNNKQLGYTSFNDETDQNVITNINGQIEVDIKPYEDYAKLLDSLKNNKADAIIMNSGTYEILSDLDNFLGSKTRIIDKIKITISREELSAKGYHNNEPFNVYISGIDTYGEISKVARSDVNIVATINPETHEIVLTTIPRDMYVQLHDTTGLRDKLTHAGVYGINKSMTTIEDFLDIEIDYYIRINFSSLLSLVDTIGGVDVYNEYPFTRSRKYPVGMVHLNGKEALEFSRERKLLPGGDNTRGKNQEKVITAIIEKVSSDKKLLANYADVMKSLDGLFETSVPQGMFTKYVKNQINKMSKWNVNSIFVEGSPSSAMTYTIPGMMLYVTEPDSKSVQKCHNVISQIMSGIKYDDIK